MPIFRLATQRKGGARLHAYVIAASLADAYAAARAACARHGAGAFRSAWRVEIIAHAASRETREPMPRELGDPWRATVSAVYRDATAPHAPRGNVPRPMQRVA